MYQTFRKVIDTFCTMHSYTPYIILSIMLNSTLFLFQ
jgi:hypothetical protein